MAHEENLDWRRELKEPHEGGVSESLRKSVEDKRAEFRNTDAYRDREMRTPGTPDVTGDTDQERYDSLMKLMEPGEPIRIIRYSTPSGQMKYFVKACSTQTEARKAMKDALPDIDPVYGHHKDQLVFHEATTLWAHFRECAKDEALEKRFGMKATADFYKARTKAWKDRGGESETYTEPPEEIKDHMKPVDDYLDGKGEMDAAHTANLISELDAYIANGGEVGPYKGEYDFAEWGGEGMHKEPIAPWTYLTKDEMEVFDELLYAHSEAEDYEQIEACLKDALYLAHARGEAQADVLRCGAGPGDTTETMNEKIITKVSAYEETLDAETLDRFKR